MSTLVELREPGGAITVETAGGSGFGDPHARPVELIQRDLEEGYVTPDGIAAYGGHARIEDRRGVH
jgi:N-methylhydantoinase B/oxoprolinase/acetone carboxylase alpha subunit